MGKKGPKTIACYTHSVPSDAETVINPEPGYYYVSVKCDSQLDLALGPFEYHQQALDYFYAVKALVEEHDPRGHFYIFGTYGITDQRYGNEAHTIPGRIRSGTLNRHFPDAPVMVVAPKAEAGA